MAGSGTDSCSLPLQVTPVQETGSDLALQVTPVEETGLASHSESASNSELVIGQSIKQLVLSVGHISTIAMGNDQLCSDFIYTYTVVDDCLLPMVICTYVL